MYFNLCFSSFFFPHLKWSGGTSRLPFFKNDTVYGMPILPFKNKGPGRFYGISYFLPAQHLLAQTHFFKENWENRASLRTLQTVESWMVSTVGQMFTLTPSGCLGGNVHEGTKPKGKSILPGSGTFWAQSSFHQERTQPALGQVWTHLDGVISGSSVVLVPVTSTDRLLAISPNGTWWHRVPGS